jgi:hypothetical protein
MLSSLAFGSYIFGYYFFYKLEATYPPSSDLRSFNFRLNLRGAKVGFSSSYCFCYILIGLLAITSFELTISTFLSLTSVILASYF